MKKNDTLMVFPCDFQMKVIGINNESFANDVASITRKHFPTITDDSIRSQISQQQNYLAITLSLYVQDQQTLDLLYMELTKHPHAKLVL